jgi:hypothetical protein
METTPLVKTIDEIEYASDLQDFPRRFPKVGMSVISFASTLKRTVKRQLALQ